MTDLIRPELRAWIARWHEALIGLGVMALGLYWALTSWGLLAWLGWGLAALGPVMAFAGVQRGRFRTGSGGPGVVTVDEGQVAYFGPLTGGAVALSELTRLSLDGESAPPCWVLDQPGQPALQVPLNAEGADALFDVFAALPGIKTDRMLEEMRRSDMPRRVVIWEKSRDRMRLH
ncbi:hypothetical protein [Pseudooceanicola onchidii]|uniref:hypothetical protein n=1 Tax=Pseudooceanicola onchidii TaxID=2562279 RepID=UPI0010AA8034|nr:hypothetical protein [Pseudooceanicola onchidii]